MKIEKKVIPYQQTNSFSKLVIDYLNHYDHLKQYIQNFPTAQAISTQIKLKQVQQIDRVLLRQVLNEQYKAIEFSQQVNDHLELLLNANTFTICTAHQPIIFTGPLYFIYKIIHVIKLAKECSIRYPDYSFVPVYYMGSEDNDLDEIGSFHLYDKTYQWLTSQTGACGRMHTHELKRIVAEIRQLLNENNQDEASLINLFEMAYDGTHTLSEATRIIVNALFGKYGLIVLDGDHPKFKQKFIPVIQDELFNRRSSEIVNETNSVLSKEYKVQANPREINLFYLNDQTRERIEFKDNHWQVVNTDLTFTKEEIEEQVLRHPERFSPNVILRPLYQETLLPNIAFVGGGGELAYWIELKKLFEHYHLAYPLLFLRNSILWINEKTSENIQKTGLSLDTFFKTHEEIFVQYLGQVGQTTSLQHSLNQLNTEYEHIIELATAISPQLQRSMKAQKAKAARIEARIQQKFKAHLKKKEAIMFDRIGAIKHQIAPYGILQERYDNFISIVKITGIEMLDMLLEQQEGFGEKFIILTITSE